MNIKETSQLDEILKGTSLEEIDRYVLEEGLLPEYTIQTYFNEYIAKHGLKVSVIVEKSRIAREYAYQILNGRKKNPSRDKLLSLCLGAEMELKDVQRILHISHQGILYSKNVRDAVIIVCIHHRIYDIDEINEYLKEKGCTAIGC